MWPFIILLRCIRIEIQTPQTIMKAAPPLQTITGTKRVRVLSVKLESKIPNRTETLRRSNSPNSQMDEVAVQGIEVPSVLKSNLESYFEPWYPAAAPIKTPIAIGIHRAGREMRHAKVSRTTPREQTRRDVSRMSGRPLPCQMRFRRRLQR